MIPSARSAGPSLCIRAVTAGDAEVVARLSGELGYERSADEVRQWLERLESLREVIETHAGVVPAVEVLVACEGDAVLGWVQVEMQRHLQDGERGLIAGLVVDAAARGRGVGAKLCRAAEAWVLARGVKAMRVTSRSTRERAHQFYLRDGYVQVKTSAVFEKALG